MLWCFVLSLLSLGSICWASNRTRKRQPWPFKVPDAFLHDDNDLLKELFLWHAEPDGKLTIDGFRRLINVQQTADGLPPIPRAYARMVRSMYKARDGHDVNALIEDYRNTFFFRKKLLRDWTNCCWMKYNGQDVSSCDAVWRVFSFDYLCGDVKDLKAPDPRMEALFSLQKKVEPEEPNGGFSSTPLAVAKESAGFQRQLSGNCQIQTSMQCSLPSGPLPVALGGPSYEDPNHRRRSGAAKGKGRLAVLVVGLKERFYPHSTLQHVVAPAARDGYRVDYHVLLEWERTKMIDIAQKIKKDWNPSKGEKVLGNYNLAKSLAQKTVGNPAFFNVTKEQLLQYVARHARHYGASTVRIQFLHSALAENDFGQPSRRYFGEGTSIHPNFRKVRMRFKNIELLWNSTLSFLRKEGLGGSYSHVMVLRDDVFFPVDVNLNLFSHPGKVFFTTMGMPCDGWEGHDEGDVSDRAFILGGEAARRFMLLETIHRDHPSKELDRARNPEHFLYVLARVLGIPSEVVPQDWFPNFLAVHVQTKSGIEFCLRGLCRQALIEPLGPCISASKVPYRSCTAIEQEEQKSERAQ